MTSDGDAMVDRGSSVGTATRYGLDFPGIESWWRARFSVPVQTGPGAQPASYTMGTGSFRGVKRPGRGVDHPPPYSAKVKERVELYIYSTSGSSLPVIGWPLTETWCVSCEYELGVELLFTEIPGFISIPGPSVWDFWWTEWRCDKFFSEFVGFVLTVSFHQCSPFIFIYMLLLQ